MHDTHLRTLLLVVGVLIGVWVGYVSPVASEIIVLCVVLAGVLAFLFVLGKITRTQSTVPLLVLLLTCGIGVGVMRVQVETPSQIFVCEKSCTVDATVMKSGESKETFQYLTVRISDEYEYVRVRAPLYPTYRIGDTLRITGTIKEPDAIFPHGDEKTFDYISYLQTKHIGSESYFPTLELVDGEAHTIPHMLGRFREALVDRLETYVSSPASSLAAGMLFGKSSVTSSLVETFRTVGLSHIIVLSGFNIVIIISSILAVLRYTPRALRIVLATGAVIAFVVMVGGEPSVIRATLMAGIALLATVVGRAYVARQALIVSLVGIVLYEPYALLHDVSLHLSFIATAGIVYMSNTIARYVDKYVRTSFLKEILVTTLAAYIVTLPYLMYTFGSLSLYALIVNIVVVPLVPIAMLLSFITLVASQIHEAIAYGVGYVTTLLLDGIIGVARIFEVLPFAQVGVEVSFGIMCVLYVALITTVMYLHARHNETLHTEETDNGEIFRF